MRISSHQAQQTAIDAMLEQQQKLSHVQKQVATGRKIFRPSDDPVAAARIVDLRDTLATTKQYQDNINAARARLSLEEGVLTNATEVLQRVRELAVMANNDSQTNESRAFIAEEVLQLRDELLSLANSTDSNGEYLFAGSKSHDKPFIRNEKGEFDYHGDNTQRMIAIGPRRHIATSDTGTAAFRQVRDTGNGFIVLDSPRNTGTGIATAGNTVGDYDRGTYAIVFEEFGPAGEADTASAATAYLSYKVIDSRGNVVVPAGKPYVEGGAIEFAGIATSIEGKPEAGDFFVIRPALNQDAFTTIDRLAETLQQEHGSPASRARLHNEINRALVGLDQALGAVLEVRANVGARLNALDNQESVNEAYKLQIREILSGVEDLDYSEAVSELNLKLTGLQASQKAFSRVQGISLFNHL